MIDCGAGGAFIDQDFAKKFEQKKLDHPLTAKNVDGTINKKGTIEKYVDLEFKIDSRKFKERFYVTGLGNQKIICGFPWLQKHNPKIDWKTGKIEWKKYFLTFQQLFGKSKTNSKSMMEEQPDREEWKNQTRNPIMNAIFMKLLDEDIEINKINIATELAIEDNKKKKEKDRKNRQKIDTKGISQIFGHLQWRKGCSISRI